MGSPAQPAQHELLACRELAIPPWLLASRFPSLHTLDRARGYYENPLALALTSGHEDIAGTRSYGEGAGLLPASEYCVAYGLTLSEAYQGRSALRFRA